MTKSKKGGGDFAKGKIVPPSKKDGKVLDWYSKIPNNLKTNYHNPCFDNHKIKWPFRMVIDGYSGSFKTATCLDIIHRMSDTFALIILCVKNSNEPLYEFLRSKIPPESIQIFENGEVPEPSDYKDEDCQILVLFDDLINEPTSQKRIADWFIYGRKIAKGCSCVYITQSWFSVPKKIRNQANLIMIKKLNSMRDLTAILREFSLGLDRFVLTDIYNYATETLQDFLLIDIDAPQEERFRKGYFDIIKL